MKFSELTDEQKNRWIAERLEPLESFKMSGNMTMAALTSKICQKKCWIDDRDSIFPHDTSLWKPRDFLHDPAMRDLLLRKLIEDGWYIEINGSEYTFKVDDWGFGSFDDLPDAFILASGWKEE